MSAKASFDGFYIAGEPKYSESNGRMRVDFSICSAQKYFNGQYLKVYCIAFDEQAMMIKRLKAKRGSFVDVICEMTPYVREGKEGISYKILAFNYSDKVTGNTMKSQDEVPITGNKETSEKEANLRKAANMLANNPFA